MRRRDYLGPVLCGLGSALLLAVVAVDFDSRPARILMAGAAIVFVPGAYITLALVRRIAGPPR